MPFWANFYERLFNFREIRYFDIKGEYTGLFSKALTAQLVRDTLQPLQQAHWQAFLAAWPADADA
jgi:4-hydroxyphenylpyruvate dioxygenase-like putative hemolysin